MSARFHEDLTRDHDAEGSSDRSFGLVFAGLFALVGLLPLVHRHPMRLWALALALVLALIALALPRILAPFNRLWTRLGHLLNRIVSPVVMGALFAVAVVPTGLILRLLGRDPLRLKFDRAAATYWQRREPPGPPPQSFDNQF